MIDSRANQNFGTKHPDASSVEFADDRLNELAQRLAELQEQLDHRDQTVFALTEELAARDERINAILTCRAWRWSQRVSDVKRILWLPVDGFFQRLHRNGKKRQSKIAGTPLVAASRPQRLTRSEEEIVLLPVPRLSKAPSRESETSRATDLRPDVICFSIIDWNFRFQRPQQIMSQFAAQGHRVFFIELHQMLPVQSRQRFSLKRLKENLYQITLSALRLILVNQEDVKGANSEMLLAALDELRRDYGIGEAIAYVMTPSWTTMALEARRRWGWRVIYDCMDDWDGFPGIGRLATQAEDKLVRNCDLLVVTADRLVEKWRSYDRPTVLARNAVDYDFYQEHGWPNNLLLRVQHPIVGYFGAIADWFDLDLMVEVARRRPGYTFVLLGGVFEVDVTELRNLHNVRVLGQQPYETMPQYLYHFDACLIPFKINRTTEATDPVKVYEYLSGGKPVVSVALPELESLSDLVYLARDRDHFVAQLDRALAEDDPALSDRRREFAAQHTWNRRYETIVAGLKNVSPLVSIVVVTYNGLAMNRLCLESVIRNTDYPSYEVIVVDNKSNDGTPDYLQQLANQHQGVKLVLNPENRGFPRAVNQGIAASSGDYLVILNNDTIVPPGWLSRLLRHLEDPDIGLVGPVTNFTGNEAKVDVDYRTLGEMETFAEEFMRINDGRIADIHMLAMFCVAFRRDTYEKVGPLDEQFGIGMFEDDDYALRIKAAGLRVVCAADVFVHHFGQAAFKKLIRTGLYDEMFRENRRHFESKWNVKWIPHKNAPLQFGSSEGTRSPDS